MSDESPKKRDLFAGIKMPKHAVAVGIVIGGILGSTLAFVTLHFLRSTPTETYDPADLAPVKVVPPRRPDATATPTPK